MKAWRRHPFRVVVRFFWMGAELALAALTYICRCALRSAASHPRARPLWLQYSCRRFLHIFGLQAQGMGSVPDRGLLICNHLTYLDSLVLASITPCVFVSKREVRHWPVFGWFTTVAGTVYVDRERRTHVASVTDEIQTVLDRGLLVVLFPEGTSSDGRTVLPLKTALLEPAAAQDRPLSVGLIEYQIDEGDVTGEVCYWGDMTFFPHLVNVFGLPRIRATVRFASVQRDTADRKELARQLHAELLRLKQSP
jgi:1-acyl-sn-glycerol-3-phosphate acyltransferase